jgi:hypothetical protein
VLSQIAASKAVIRNLGAIGRCLAIMERRARQLASTGCSRQWCATAAGC